MLRLIKLIIIFRLFATGCIHSGEIKVFKSKHAHDDLLFTSMW